MMATRVRVYIIIYIAIAHTHDVFIEHPFYKLPIRGQS